MGWWRKRPYRDFRCEIEAHVDLETDRLVSEGLDPAEARKAAIRRFGNRASAGERFYESGRAPWLDALSRDGRHALRGLARSPGFTLLALLIIVVAVGGLSTVFTLIDSVLLEPLPYPESDRIVRIRQEDTAFGSSQSAAMADVDDIRQENTSFEAIVAYSDLIYERDPETDPYYVLVWRATPDTFPFLGLTPVMGRGLLAEDAGPGTAPVAVLSHRFWAAHFGSSEDVIGEPLALSRGPESIELTIVGVLAPESVPPVGGNQAGDFMMFPTVWTALGSEALEERGRRGVTALARLRSGVSLESAQAEATAISGRLAAAYPETNAERLTNVVPLVDEVVPQDTQRILRIFLAAVACVFIVAVANLTSLQAVRTTRRGHEMYVRMALGAGRLRVIRQALVEAVTLSLAGGLLGLAAAWGSLRVLLTALPERFPRAEAVDLDVTVAAVAMVSALLAGVVFGTLPAIRTSRPDLRTVIGEGERSVSLTRTRSRFLQTLIGAETAVALVLLVGAALLAASFWNLYGEDAGMDEDNLWALTVDLPQRYERAAESAFWQDAVASIRSLEAVESVSAVVNTRAPLTGGDIRVAGLLPEGSTADRRREGLSVSHRVVLPEYLETVGIPVLRGRTILPTDLDGNEPVVVLNETAAGALWPGEDSIGKRVMFGRTSGRTVIGIVPDFKHQQLSAEVAPQMFTPYLQDNSPGTAGAIMIRMRSGETAAFGGVVQTAITNIEADAELSLAPMSELRWQSLATERFRTGILILFGVTAGFLALVGNFGVVSYTVTHRQRELGLRVALGARIGQAVGLVVRQSMWPVLIGLGAGFLASLAASRLLSGYLFGVEAADPVVLVATLAVLGIATLAASTIPVWRAAKIDPMTVLRHE